MKLPDLPAHPVRRSFIRSSGTLSNNGWTSAEADAIRQIQREAYIAALEEAAKLLDELHAKDTLTNYHGFAANKVRALKEKIE